MSDQFFLAPEARTGEKSFRLSGKEARHMTKVLRLGEGDEVRFFDGSGRRFSGTISAVELGGDVTGTLEALAASAAPAGPPIVLCAALLKSDRWEWLLEKASELGVASIVPVETARAVVRLSADQVPAKLERWRKLALEACKQSGRATVPAVDAPMGLGPALAQAKAKGLILFAWEGLRGAGARATLAAALKNHGGDPIHIFVGPEGGFTQEEVDQAKACGAAVFGLGQNVLRGETAALAACALVRYELGEV